MPLSAEQDRDASPKTCDGYANRDAYCDANIDEIDSVTLSYGGSNNPLSYNPAHFLAARNLNDYADALPQAYYALDFLPENPARDAVMIQGVTELKLKLGINSGVSVASAAAIRLVQEHLFG